jgi:hypothetical protein
MEMVHREIIKFLKKKLEEKVKAAFFFSNLQKKSFPLKKKTRGSIWPLKSMRPKEVFKKGRREFHEHYSMSFIWAFINVYHLFMEILSGVFFPFLFNNNNYLFNLFYKCNIKVEQVNSMPPQLLCNKAFFKKKEKKVTKLVLELRKQGLHTCKHIQIVNDTRQQQCLFWKKLGENVIKSSIHLMTKNYTLRKSHPPSSSIY